LILLLLNVNTQVVNHAVKLKDYPVSETVIYTIDQFEMSVTDDPNRMFAIASAKDVNL
jgi:succinylglutamate desuccinylase